MHERLGRILALVDRLHRPLVITALAITVIAVAWGAVLAAQGNWGGWHGALRHFGFAAILLFGIGVRERQHRRYHAWISRTRDSDAPGKNQVGVSGDS